MDKMKYSSQTESGFYFLLLASHLRMIFLLHTHNVHFMKKNDVTECEIDLREFDCNEFRGRVFEKKVRQEKIKKNKFYFEKVC